MPRIEHFAIFATDLETTKNFYTDVLGLRVVVDNTSAPVRGYFVADDHGTVLEIVERPPTERAASTRYICHTAVWVDDYDAARAALVNHGVSLELDSEVNTPAVRTIFFPDPDGNRCQIIWRSSPLGTSLN